MRALPQLVEPRMEDRVPRRGRVNARPRVPAFVRELVELAWSNGAGGDGARTVAGVQLGRYLAKHPARPNDDVMIIQLIRIGGAAQRYDSAKVLIGWFEKYVLGELEA